jgi:hypothetical protein
VKKKPEPDLKWRPPRCRVNPYAASATPQFIHKCPCTFAQWFAKAPKEEAWQSTGFRRMRDPATDKRVIDVKRDSHWHESCQTPRFVTSDTGLEHSVEYFSGGARSADIPVRSNVGREERKEQPVASGFWSLLRTGMSALRLGCDSAAVCSFAASSLQAHEQNH